MTIIMIMLTGERRNTLVVAFEVGRSVKVVVKQSKYREYHGLLNLNNQP